MRTPWRTSPKSLAWFILASTITIVAAMASPVRGASQPEAPAEIQSITGTGSQTAYRAIVKWADQYQKARGVSVNFQSIGSGAGVKQIESKTVDFAIGGALDLDSARRIGLAQWPVVVSGVVPVANLPGIPGGTLKLNGRILADVYLGKIKKWNDPAIRALNARAKLPNLDILPIHWSTGSQMTLAFTSYLSEASTEWRVRVGANFAAEWPTGVGAKGDEGVAAAMIQTPGAIGYVDYAFAEDNGLAVVLVANQDGKYVRPDSASFAKCVAMFGANEGPAPQHLMLGRNDAWAICEVAFVFVHQVADDPRKTAAVLAFFDWAMSNGAVMASQIHLGIPPSDVAARIRELWKQQVRSEDGRPVYP